VIAFETSTRIRRPIEQVQKTSPDETRAEPTYVMVRGADAIPVPLPVLV
jgi:hypothetical protein